MVSFNKIFLIISIALLIAAGFNLLLSTTAEDKAAMMQCFQEAPGDTSKAAGIAFLGYDLSTPAIYTEEWIGDENERTWMLEEIPLPDSKDAFILVPYWLVGMFIFRILNKARENKKIRTRTLIIFALLYFIVGTIIIWIIWKTVMYNLFMNGAEGLCAQESIIQTREAINTGTNNSEGIFWLLAYSMISLTLLAFAMIKSGGK